MAATHVLPASHSSCYAPARQTLLARLHHMAEVARTRRALRKLAPHQLEDLGIGAREAAREATRSFWDAPAAWRA